MAQAVDIVVVVDGEKNPVGSDRAWAEAWARHGDAWIGWHGVIPRRPASGRNGDEVEARRGGARRLDEEG